jgi:hypothetical protein
VGAYETSKAVDEYVQLHYASADEVFPYEDAPKVWQFYGK